MEGNYLCRQFLGEQLVLSVLYLYLYVYLFLYWRKMKRGRYDLRRQFLGEQLVLQSGIKRDLTPQLVTHSADESHNRSSDKQI